MASEDNSYAIRKEVQPDDSGSMPAVARIPLKKKRMSAEGTDPRASRSSNPMNRLVPYLDLFGRLDDQELARLAGVDNSVVVALRKQVVQVQQALARYADLLPRLADGELMRLTGATAKTVRFWRLCQPKRPAPSTPVQAAPPQTETVAPAGKQAPESEPEPEVAAPLASIKGEPFPGYEQNAAAPDSQAISVGALFDDSDAIELDVEDLE